MRYPYNPFSAYLKNCDNVYYVPKTNQIVVSAYCGLTKMAAGGFNAVCLDPLELYECIFLGEL